MTTENANPTDPPELAQACIDYVNATALVKLARLLDGEPTLEVCAMHMDAAIQLICWWPTQPGSTPGMAMKRFDEIATRQAEQLAPAIRESLEQSASA